MRIKTYNGSRQDLEHYKGYPVINHEFEILNDDGSDFDFTGEQGIWFKIFQKQHGTLVDTFSKANGNISRSSNVITVSVDAAYLNLRPKEYYQELYWVNADDENDLIFHGIYAFI